MLNSLSCRSIFLSHEKVEAFFSILFSPNLIDQSSCRILTTDAKTRPILHDDWSIWLGENRPDMVLKHLAAMLNMVQ